MLNCKQASELVSRSLDQPLPWSKRIQLKFHLLICKFCMRFFKQMHGMKIAATQLQQSIESDDSIKLSDSAKQKIQDQLKDQ